MIEEAAIDYLAEDVRADQVRLRQVLLNLLANAVRFSKVGGLTVRAEHQDQQIVASVQNTGPGIAPEQIPLLYKEFSQLCQTDERERRAADDDRVGRGSRSLCGHGQDCATVPVAIPGMEWEWIPKKARGGGRAK